MEDEEEAARRKAKAYYHHRVDHEKVRYGEDLQKQRVAEIKDIRRRAGTNEETEEEKFFRLREEKATKHYECKSCGHRTSYQPSSSHYSGGCPECGKLNPGYTYSSEGFGDE